MAKKLKVPKRIAGVKIPKSVRKGPVGTFLNSTAGQVLVAEAVLAAAGAVLVRSADPHSRTGQALRHPLQQLKRASRAAVHSGARTKGAAAEGSERLAEALREGVAAFRASLDRGAVEPRAGELDVETPVESESNQVSDGKKKHPGADSDRQTPH